MSDTPPIDFNGFLNWLRSKYHDFNGDGQNKSLQEKHLEARQRAKGSYMQVPREERPHSWSGPNRAGHEDPTGPTAHLPGTWEKIMVMQERAEKGLGLFHHHDAVLDRD